MTEKLINLKVRPETRNLLHGLKHVGETYDDVVNMLYESMDEHKVEAWQKKRLREAAKKR